MISANHSYANPRIGLSNSFFYVSMRFNFSISNNLIIKPNRLNIDCEIVENEEHGMYKNHDFALKVRSELISGLHLN